MTGPRLSILDVDDPPAKAAGLEAALSLFVRKGVDATSVREIAAQSGYTNPSLFKHFDTKTALALCLFERCHGWLMRSVIAADTACADPDPVARITAIAACALRLIDEDIEAVLMVQDNLRRFWREAAPDTRAASLLGRVRRLVEAAVADRKQADGGVAPTLLASAIVGLLGQIAREAYFGELPGSASACGPHIGIIVTRLLDRRGLG